MAETDLTPGFFKGRNFLAGAIAVFSIALLIAIAAESIYTIGKAGGNFDQTIAALNSLYSTFLPLIGTWMGAVIAFYFGKENFEAANKNVQDMIQKIITSEDKLKSIKVSDPNVMITIDNIFDNKDIRTKADKDIMIEKDILNFFDTNVKFERLPIMNDVNAIRYVIHKSLISDFALSFKRGKITIPNLTNDQLDKVTLDNLINNTTEEYKLSVTKSAAFVSRTSSLLEVQNMINNFKYCQDVFVTENGSPDKPIIGWITNNKVTELGKV
jgi:hypothetical protein